MNHPLTTHLMDAIVMDRSRYVNTINDAFREWSGIRGLSSNRTGLKVTSCTQIVPSNLRQFDQKFNCACGYTTHSAGKFWDHVHGGCDTLDAFLAVDAVNQETV
jgi:hypothetical protein